jgi:hypothetical protein
MRRLIVSLLVILFLNSLFLSKTFAQVAITVTPQIQKIDLSNDEPEAVVYYKNGTGETIELEFDMQDIKDFTEEGVPSFLDAKSSENYKYGLASWAQIAAKSMVLEPGEEKSVKVYIDRTRLPLGGHYAALLAEIKQPGESKDVKLRAIIASLIFVRSGSEFNREEASIDDFWHDEGLLGFPKSFSFRFHNTGNVDVIPYGQITIYDSLGNQVARSIVNDGSLATLPETIRRYKTFIKPTQSVIIPGIYRAEVSLHYGEDEKEVAKEILFLTLGSLTSSSLIIILLIPVTLLLLRKLKRSGKKIHDTV